MILVRDYSKELTALQALGQLFTIEILLSYLVIIK